MGGRQMELLERDIHRVTGGAGWKKGNATEQNVD